MDRHRRMDLDLVLVGCDRDGRGTDMSEDIACVTREVDHALQPWNGARRVHVDLVPSPSASNLECGPIVGGGAQRGARCVRSQGRRDIVRRKSQNDHTILRCPRHAATRSMST